MRIRWARRAPAYVVNGVTVSVGLALVQAVAGSLLSRDLSQAASIGALLASLPHLTGRALPTLRRTLVGGLLASLATLAVLLTQEPVLRGGVVAGVAFAALLGMAWGTKAAPMVFSVLLGVIFTLARQDVRSPVPIALASAFGVVAYALWATVTAKLLESRYRVLAVASVLDAAASLLRARAEVLTSGESDAAEDTNTTEMGGETHARFDQLTAEVRLAQALQTARDLVYPARARGAGELEAALLSRVAELREIVLTSRLDLDHLGHDHAARFVRARLAVGLRRLSERVSLLALALRDASLEDVQAARGELPDMLEARELLEHDERSRLLPVVAARLRYLGEEVEAMRHLLLGDGARSSLAPAELERFVSDDDTWPLAALRGHFTLDSPVLRHALRSTLALSSAYFLASAMPWSTRPYWMLLSVVVVLRGTLDDTLSRRNQRVLGTAIGCVAVTVIVPLASESLLKLTFVAAVGVAHAFVNVRYLLTAIAATVMALLQAHFAEPTTASLVIERVLDTVLGALLAWGFSYVLPSWERRTLPAALERALEALEAYAESALDLAQLARADQRLLRQRAYDALEVVAAAVRRSAAEPRRVQPPSRELVGALDHAQRLMAHLSSVRSLLQRRGEHLSRAAAGEALVDARRAIAERLSLAAPPVRSRVPSWLDPSELPGAPAEHDPLPWLLRRLEAGVHDAGVAGESARRALRALRRP